MLLVFTYLSCKLVLVHESTGSIITGEISLSYKYVCISGQYRATLYITLTLTFAP